MSRYRPDRGTHENLCLYGQYHRGICWSISRRQKSIQIHRRLGSWFSWTHKIDLFFWTWDMQSTAYNLYGGNCALFKKVESIKLFWMVESQNFTD